MSLIRSFLLTVAIGLPSVVAHAQSGPMAPQPQDPTLRALHQQALQLWPQTLNEQLLAWPATVTPWPCAVDDLSVRRWTGGMALGTDDFTEEQRRHSMASLRSTGSTQTRMEISDVKVAPISGQCVNGKLQGPVEALLEYTKTQRQSAGAPPMVMTYRARLQATVDKGVLAPKTPRVMAQKTLRFDTVDVDGKPLQVPLTTSLNIQISHSDFEYHSVHLSAPAGGAGVTHTVFSLPVAPDVVEMWTYADARLASTGRLKRARMHGEHVMHQADGSKNSMCWDEGELIQAVTCDVR